MPKEVVAACRGEPPDIFFEEEYIDQALEICEKCPMRVQCRDFALEHKIVDGVWGGISPNRLRTMVE